VLWWHRGTLIQEREHMERLEASARRLYMDLQHGPEALGEAIRATCRAAEVGPEEDAYVRLVVTRGVGPLGLDPTLAPRRTVVVIVAPAVRPSAAEHERGLHAALVARRRTPEAALDPRAKTGNYLNNVLALHEARLAGADDAIMLNERLEVTEATTSNVYLVRGGGLVTPSVGSGLLPGTTRARILALCRGAGIQATEERVLARDLVEAEEVFLSSSVRGVLPVTRIDGRPVGSGARGALTLTVHRLFEAAADSEAAEAGRAARTGPARASEGR
jgi:branched-chain amino acid aminotransferase